MAGRRDKGALERLQALAAARTAPELATAGSPPARQPAPSAKRSGAVGALVLLGALAWKFKAVLLLVLGKSKLLLAGLKLGNLLTTGSTMLVMAWSYSWFYGWPFAAGFVVLILVHELGHGVAARSVGLNVGPPVFVPFFGAFIGLRQQPRSTFQDFVIGAGGPLAGSLGGAACIALSFAIAGPAGGLLRALGFFTLLLNLFNLMPVWQLDGARMLAPVPPGTGFAGVLLLAVVLFVAAAASPRLNPMALIVVALGGYRFATAWWRSRRHPSDATALERLSAGSAPTSPPDAHVTPGQRLTAASVYFGLAGILVVAVHLLDRHLPAVGP